MKELRKVKGGLTEKGNLKPAAREGIKTFSVKNFLGDFIETPKGDLVMAVADVDGKTAYLRIKASISIDEGLFDEPVAKTKAKADTSVDLSNLLD